jgi:hypothetical protein
MKLIKLDAIDSTNEFIKSLLLLKLESYQLLLKIKQKVRQMGSVWDSGG